MKKKGKVVEEDSDDEDLSELDSDEGKLYNFDFEPFPSSTFGKLAVIIS